MIGVCSGDFLLGQSLENIRPKAFRNRVCVVLPLRCVVLVLNLAWRAVIPTVETQAPPLMTHMTTRNGPQMDTWTAEAMPGIHKTAAGKGTRFGT